MSITATNWQAKSRITGWLATQSDSGVKSSDNETDTIKEAAAEKTAEKTADGETAKEAQRQSEKSVKDSDQADMDTWVSSFRLNQKSSGGLFGSISSQKSQDSDGFQMKSSGAKDTTGQLAAMLARAETKLDVHQVYGRAMRALANLKMSAASCEGDEAKKLAQKIRRMEKLMKRIEKKLKHLNKEEQLERQQKRAVEKQETAKAEQLKDELQTRRKKRRRDEKNYATKELAEDQKESNSGLTSALAGVSGSSIPTLDAAAGGVDFSMSAAEGVSLDITV